MMISVFFIYLMLEIFFLIWNNPYVLNLLNYKENHHEM